MKAPDEIGTDAPNSLKLAGRLEIAALGGKIVGPLKISGWPFHGYSPKT